MVALHVVAGAGQDGDAGAVAARGIAADETMAGGQSEDVAAGADSGALAVGDAGDGPCGVLHLERACLQLGRRGIPMIVIVELRRIAAKQPVLGREAGPGIFRRLARHRRRALDQGFERVLGEIGGGDAGRAAADEQSKADLLAFRAGDVLELAEPDLNLGRLVADVEDVGGIGAGLDRDFDKGRGAPFGFTDFEHQAQLGCVPGCGNGGRGEGGMFVLGLATDVYVWREGRASTGSARTAVGGRGLSPNRHPELGSGSSPPSAAMLVAGC